MVQTIDRPPQTEPAVAGPDGPPGGLRPPPERPRREPSDRPFLAAVTAVLLVGAMFLVMLVLVPQSPRTANLGPPTPAAQPASRPAPAPAAQPATGATPIQIELGDVYVKPGAVDVEAGTEVVLAVTNRGKMAHDLKLNGTTGTRLLNPGESETVNLGAFTTSAMAWCTVPGHKQAGMVLALNVKGSAAAAAQPSTPAGPAATLDFAAEPAAGWKAANPALAAAAAGRVHKLTLSATETTAEVAPGVRQQIWSFNGQTPGPVLRGRVGDTFEITLVNDGKMGHSIDFHASKVAWNDEMRTIQPGERLIYRFTAKHAGIFMYHCGTAPTLHHIGNGMYGAIIIDPPGLPRADREYLLVQSELYLGPQDGPGDLGKMQAERWDAVVFNGYVNQYKHAPIRVEPGQRVRAWILDAGPSENSSFHVVGTVFDTVYREGAYTLRPDAGKGGAQALDLQPAQGGFVEFTFDEPGLYPIVTHKFANVGKGALGLFQAGEVSATGAGGH